MSRLGYLREFESNYSSGCDTLSEVYLLVDWYQLHSETESRCIIERYTFVIIIAGLEL